MSTKQSNGNQSAVNVTVSHAPKVARRLEAIHDETIRHVLQGLVYIEKIVTVDELAAEIGLSNSAVYKRIEGDATITGREILIWARYLQSKGIGDLLNLAVPPSSIVIPCDELCVTATLETEIVETVREAGAVIQDVENGKTNKAKRDADKLVKAATSVRRTVERGRR